MKKIFLLLWLFFLIDLTASEMLQIDFDGRKDDIYCRSAGNSPGLKTSLANWIKIDDRPHYRIWQGVKPLSGKWQEFEVAFVPEKSGALTFLLRGTYTKDRTAKRIQFDRLQMSGAKLVNPGFEELDNGMFTGWEIEDAALLLDRGDAGDGKNYTQASFRHPVAQEITVKKGQKVTVRFLARAVPAAAEASPVVESRAPGKLQMFFDGRKDGIYCKPGNVSGGLYTELARWIQIAERPQVRAFQSRRTLPQTWKEYSISFIPEKSGDLVFNIRSMYTRDKRIAPVQVDNIRIKGAEIVNPSFEKLANNAAAGWICTPWSVCRDLKDAPHGKNYAQVTHEFYLRQTLKVKAGVPVEVTFSARSGMETDRFAGPREHPRAFYRYQGGGVELLPLSHKGYPAELLLMTPFIPEKRAVPTAQFTVPDDRTPARNKALRIPVELLEESGLDRHLDMRFGVPFAKGVIRNFNNIRVLDPAGRAVPAQFSALSFYPDRSIRWALVQFPAFLKAGERAVYAVEFGRDIVPPAFVSPLKHTVTADGVRVETGALSANISRKNFRFLENVTVYGKKVGSFAPGGLELTDESGKLLCGSKTPVKISVEESGSQRLTLRIDGVYGEKFSGYTVRLGFTANSPAVQIQITHYNRELRTEFTDITSLALRFDFASPVKSLKMDDFSLPVPAKFFQRTELDLQLQDSVKKAGLSGGGEVTCADGRRVTVYLKNAAERYPKAFEADENSVTFALLPELPDKNFGKDLPHYLQFPFCEGKYRTKWGMSFTEDIKIDFSGKTSAAELSALSVVPVIGRDYLASTGVFPGVLPAGDQRFADFDRLALTAFDKQLIIRRRQREYGFFNYGDGFGERGKNWVNNEYDLANGLLLLFARTGNRAVYRRAMEAAWHQADVDIVHAYPDPFYVGSNVCHSIGHSGIFWNWSFPYTDAHTGGRNGHTWVEGMLNAWAMSGEARIMDASLLLGDHLARFIAPTFVTLGQLERTGGWSLKALTALYQSTGEKYYLDACSLIAAVALREQRFDHGGAWAHVLPKDHAGGVKNTMGNVPFLVGVLAEAMYQYYLVSGNEAAAKSVISAARWLKNSYDPAGKGWPSSASWDGKPYHGTPEVLLLAGAPTAAGAILAGDKEKIAIARDTMQLMTLQGVSPGCKNLAMDLCLAAELMERLYVFGKKYPAEAYRFDSGKAVEIRKNGNYEYRLRAPDKKCFIVRLNKDQVNLTLVRRKHGAKPKSKPEYTFSIQDPAGKSVAQRTLPTKEAYQETFVLSGAKGDIFKVFIDDDLTAVWHIEKSADATVWALLPHGSTVGNSKIGMYSVTIPAGTEKFFIDITVQHNVGFTAHLIDSAGKIRASTGGASGNIRLAWSEEQNEPERLNVVLPEKTAKDEVWNLLLFCSSGDLRIDINGIPRAVSLGDEVLPAEFR